MKCGICDAEADRTCTQCGRFFCPSHGGMRKCVQGKGVVKRALCDECTPNQRFLTYGPVIGVIAFACITAVVYFTAILPMREESEKRRQDNEREFQRRQEEMNKQPGFNQPDR